ncbi:hypothetical protein TSUD_02670 [Trifolium subterraneum]|uniref:Uncharacterized protein n=1 Tax=Trifolium subterraneum TaxID=3900 RepID=A0A2Z6MT71_TRISU|nr:hypothetical protein TSUD_02670 [Trifolium subterraneum]
MMILLACVAYPAIMSRTLLSDSSIDEIHSQWMIKYGRTYANTSEMEKRRAIFKENLEFIEKMNNMNKVNGKNYTLGLDDFSDLTIEEMTSCCGIMDIPSELASSKTVFFNMSIDDIPESVDWRDHGAVTSVKQQGACGGCWAFATIAALEGLWQIRTGGLISLSPQYLIDCDTGSQGCRYGYLDSAFKFATRKHYDAIPTEDTYPYKGVQQTCNDNIVGGAAFDGYQLVSRGDEQQLLQAVAQQPVAAAIAAGHYDFRRFMGSEIYKGECGPSVNHAITIVGYGVSDDGEKYWIIKNSWGINWGDSGYMKLIRGTGSPGDHCNILDYPYYPTLEESIVQPKPHN